MPIHNWPQVENSIFQDFQMGWICQLARKLNEAVLPKEYYALLEPQCMEVGSAGISNILDAVAVRSVRNDQLVAVLEVLSPSKNSIKALIEKACELLEHKVHLLLLDLFPPTKRDPQGIHGALWEMIHEEEEPFQLPAYQPLTLAAYETGLTTKGYIETVGVGEVLPEMPLFLEPGGCVMVPLEKTYQAAFAAVPRRWRTVLEPLV